MNNYSVAIMVYGQTGSNRNALTEEKYKNLADAFIAKGIRINSVIYNDGLADLVFNELLRYDAILVWVNPIEQGNDRKKLDALLSQLSINDCFVSAHPETILKIGTKEILYKTRETDFGGDVKRYSTFTEFTEQFASPVSSGPLRILKQYRGNGGNGVFKIDISEFQNNRVAITHATENSSERILPVQDFFGEMKIYFDNHGMLIDQEWNPNIINGMVRCYLTGTKVAGFGYQEINALYPSAGTLTRKPGKRFYFSEDCGLFQDLRKIMELDWVPQLQEITSAKTEMLPVIWDADFFINKINEVNAAKKYTLCEINASCVSPFPESAIPYIVEEVCNKLASRK